MVYCAVFGCNNDSRYTTGISYHCFPSDKALRSQWLAKISQADLVVLKNSRLCSEHFTPDCYERDLKAEILGLKPRSTLKPGAIPTYIASITAQPSCGIEEHAASALEQPAPVDVVNCGASTSTSDSPSYPFPHDLGPKSTLVESSSAGSSTQTEEVFLPEIEDNKEEATEAAASPEVSPRKDGIYLPTKQEDSDDSNLSGSDNEHQGETKCEKPQDDTKYIVFKQELFKLFKYCPECGAVVIKRNQSTQGSQLFVTLECMNNHKYS
nr:THAP domain-containing protein 3-like [Pocillopora verrucosa]